MASDAEERQTMMKSYLALINDESASAEDQTIILGAIFGPSQHDVVRDGGSPDASHYALLTKTMDGKTRYKRLIGLKKGRF